MMRFPLKLFTILVPLLVAGSILARADERCSGTLCDLYYGGAQAPAPAAAAKPAAPTPIMVPQGGIMGFFKSGSGSNTAPSDANGTPSSSVSSSRVRVGGGGLLGLARGETPERCSGTICDLYYGGPPPEKPEQPTAAAAPSDTAADAAAADLPDEQSRASRRSRVEYVEQREEKPGCAPTPQDPWRCYRR